MPLLVGLSNAPVSCHLRTRPMTFISPEFLVFWIAVVALLRPIQANHGNKAVLLAASGLFCGWSHPWFLLPLVASAASTFWLGRELASEANASKRKIWLTAAVAVNVGLLGYFKYSSFLLGAFGIPPRSHGAILPLGISFYTIQAIGYAIDVYRRPGRAAGSFLDFALYLSFFPRLVAGPILRSAQFLPQLAERRPLSLDAETLLLFLGGAVKKSLVADNIAPLVSGVFDQPEHWPSPVIWLAVVGYTVQAYCDFSGYTDMAIAIARVLGYRLPPNFDYPFFARNPPDFWRRWHISLSSWVRDYLFTALPGSDRRGGRWLNTIATMALFGLWHGAAWTFVAWGVIHGLLLVGYDAYGALRRRLDSAYRPATGPVATALSIAAMQLCVVVAMIPFRAPTFSAAWVMIGKLVPHELPGSLEGVGLSQLQASRAAILILVFAIVHVLGRRAGRLEKRLAEFPVGLAVAGSFALGFVAYCLWPLDEPAFIYMKF